MLVAALYYGGDRHAGVALGGLTDDLQLASDRLPTKFEQDIAGLEPGGGRRRAGIHRADLRAIGRYRHTLHGEHRRVDQDREEQVHEWAGEQHRDLLPRRRDGQAAHPIDRFALAAEADEAADRQPVEGVFHAIALEQHQRARWEAESELLNFDPQPYS